MPILMPDLESYLTALGDAVLFVGDPFTVDGMQELGAKQGDVAVNFNQTFNNLAFEEATGGIPHEATLQGENPVISIPLVVGNPLLWAKLSPTGTKGGGFSRPQPVVETALALVPYPELSKLSGAQSFSYPGPAGPWVVPPGAPVNWLWFWRGYFLRPDITMRQADGQKSITTAQFQTMYFAANPEGHKIYTIGDPRAVVPPIPVLV
jgi:hypothetical protein